jgi:glucose/arabinose dehydrogenase
LVAASALLLAASALVGLACGSDEDSPSTGGGTLEPGASGAGGTGSTTTPPSTPADQPAGSEGEGPGPVNAGGTEGQSPGDIPVVPGEPKEEPGGKETPPETPPETPAAGLEPNCNPPEGAAPAMTLELVADGLDDPLFVAAAPGDASRLFIVQQGGLIRVVVDGALQEQPFLDLTQSVTVSNEQGLLGLAFHPDYATNGLFYVHFTDQQANSRGHLVEFAVDANNRSVANAGARRDVLLFPEDPQGNHNGGNLAFGPDRLLYIGMGDGGGRDDNHGETGNGQNLNTLYAKMLRIDVNGRDVNNGYSIPANNLAAQTGQQALPEIWASGLRNPWRYSFDACTGDLYIGDVGQDTTEEIDFLPASALAGTNFGWRLMEGPTCRPTDTVCPGADVAALTLPVDSYPRGVGTSVTGGYVYRGSLVPALRGRYIYADFNSARFFSFRIDDGQLADKQEITDQMRPAGGGNIDNIASFGTDNAGEVYVAAYTPGAVYRIVAAQ